MAKTKVDKYTLLQNYNEWLLAQVAQEGTPPNIDAFKEKMKAFITIAPNVHKGQISYADPDLWTDYREAQRDLIKEIAALYNPSYGSGLQNALRSIFALIQVFISPEDFQQLADPAPSICNPSEEDPDDPGDPNPPPSILLPGYGNKPPIIEDPTDPPEWFLTPTTYTKVSDGIVVTHPSPIYRVIGARDAGTQWPNVTRLCQPGDVLSLAPGSYAGFPLAYLDGWTNSDPYIVIRGESATNRPFIKTHPQHIGSTVLARNHGCGPVQLENLKFEIPYNNNDYCIILSQWGPNGAGPLQGGGPIWYPWGKVRLINCHFINENYNPEVAIPPGTGARVKTHLFGYQIEKFEAIDCVMQGAWPEHGLYFHQMQAASPSDIVVHLLRCTFKWNTRTGVQFVNRPNEGTSPCFGTVLIEDCYFEDNGFELNVGPHTISFRGGMHGDYLVKGCVLRNGLNPNLHPTAAARTTGAMVVNLGSPPGSPPFPPEYVLLENCDFEMNGVDGKTMVQIEECDVFEIKKPGRYVCTPSNDRAFDFQNGMTNYILPMSTGPDFIVQGRILYLGNVYQTWAAFQAAQASNPKITWVP